MVHVSVIPANPAMCCGNPFPMMPGATEVIYVAVQVSHVSLAGVHSDNEEIYVGLDACPVYLMRPTLRAQRSGYSGVKE